MISDSYIVNIWIYGPAYMLWPVKRISRASTTSSYTLPLKSSKNNFYKNSKILNEIKVILGDAHQAKLKTELLIYHKINDISKVENRIAWHSEK